MPRISKNLLKIFKEVAVLMAADENLSFRQAAAQVGISMSIEEAEQYNRRKAFRKLLWDEKHKYARELGENPNRSREGLIGKLELCADKLLQEGNYKQAAEVLKILAQSEGWLQPENQVNVFGQLTAADYEKLRERLKQSREAAKPHEDVRLN